MVPNSMASSCNVWLLMTLHPSDRLDATIGCIFFDAPRTVVKAGTVSAERKTRPATGAGPTAGDDVGSNRLAKSMAIQFFIAAAVLILFGLAENSPNSGMSTGSSTLGMAQLVLGLAMAGAGVYLLGATPASRVVGLCTAGATALFGAYALISGLGYVPGTIIAVYGFFHLANADLGFTGMPYQAAAPGCEPLPSPGAAPYSPGATYPAAAAYPPPQQQPTGYYGVLPSQYPAPAGPPPAASAPQPPLPPPTDPSSAPDPRFG